MSWLDTWLGATASLSVQVATLIVAILAITRLIPRMSARTRYVLWLAVPLRLCFPLALDTPVGLVPADLATPEQRLTESAVNVRVLSEADWEESERRRAILSASMANGPGTSRVSPDLEPPPIQSNLTFASILASTWGVVVFLLLAWIARRWLAVHREVAATPSVERSDVRVLLERLAGDIGMRRIPDLRSLDADTSINSPSVFGFLSPVILLPAEVVDEWSTEELEPVLLHELIHIRRLDPGVNVLQSVLQVVYFFHPLVWLASRRLRIERELVCDDEVVRRLGRAVPYARSMLRLLELDFRRRRALPLLTMAEKPSELAIRVRRLASDNSLASTFPSRWSVALAAGLGIVLILVTGQQARSAVTETPLTIVGRVSGVELSQGASPWTHAQLPVIVASVGGSAVGGTDGRTGDVDVLVDGSGTPLSIEITSGLGPQIDDAFAAAVLKTRFPVPGDGAGTSRWTISYGTDREPAGSRSGFSSGQLVRIDRIPARYQEELDASFAIIDHGSFPERDQIYREAFPAQALAVPGGPRRLLLVTRGTHVEVAGCSFGTASVRSIIRALGWKSFPAPRDDLLTDLAIEGDLILDPDSRSAERVRDLERALRSRFDDQLSLVTKIERVEILVARGHYAPPGGLEDSLIPVLSAPASLNSGFRAVSTLNGLGMLASSLAVPLIDMTTGGSDAQWWFDVPFHVDDQNEVLARLARATGLDLRIEEREVETLTLLTDAGPQIIGWREPQELRL